MTAIRNLAPRSPSASGIQEISVPLNARKKKMEVSITDATADAPRGASHQACSSSPGCLMWRSSIGYAVRGTRCQGNARVSEDG